MSDTEVDLLLGPNGHRHVAPPTSRDRDEWLTWMAENPGCVAYAMTPLDVGDGVAVVEVTRSVVPLNPNGAVHGGLLAAIADQAGALAILPKLEPGVSAVTGTLHLEYFRPARLPLTVESRVARFARSLVFVDVTITSGGQVTTAAHGTWVPTRGTPVSTPVSTPVEPA
ncbi:PaaI family thioesterase [Streptomyces sp. GQFP]|uniref:PaaI family thioesterase n=1 Tax=Streptomyces sp. GQFP TaxID=2907545 RepID=UPI001F254D32|nr:PaaI family thioesterase [Streptomyces sp. GQFP]UIX31964.1 PaaI family thioesterase [Streptomyces sp. GQFP]